MQYELFYLIGASKEAEKDEIKKRAEEIVSSKEGVFLEKETQEKRRLSYKIGKENQGIYIARRFDLAEPEKIKDINAKLNLEGSILRFIISRADELPELKSKEERINEAAKRQATSEKQVEKEKDKIEPKHEKKIVSKEKEKSEDIDKKLEELLNI